MRSLLPQSKGRVSIVGTCGPVLALRNLEVDPAKWWSHCCVLINSFPFSCHGFVPRRAPLPTVGLPSQNLVQNQQYRDAVTCLPAHTEQRFAKVAEVRIICTRSGSIVTLLPPTHQQGSRNSQGHQMNQRCTIMTKLVLCSDTHTCAPNSCATNDDRQMRMTD